MSKFIKDNHTFNRDVKIPSTSKLHLDGGGNTYITESSGDVLRLYSGGNIVFEGKGLTDVAVAAQRTITLSPKQGGISGNVYITEDTVLLPEKKLYFDNGIHTYIHQNQDDNLKFVVGGDSILALNEGGNSGNILNLGTTCAGFTQHEPTYNATDTEVYFSKLGSKAFFTFGAGSITDLNLYFPNISCNCTLVVKQDGTGSRTVTNWKSFDQDEGNPNSVKWAGGSAPTLSTGGNAIDIISFYWDNDNHTAYGVASLNFS
tara:strand:- start:27410 stop:28189 length:780 start_codon:yes stop_codon:yes gene_type:complete